MTRTGNRSGSGTWTGTWSRTYSCAGPGNLTGFETGTGTLGQLVLNTINSYSRALTDIQVGPVIIT